MNQLTDGFLLPFHEQLQAGDFLCGSAGEHLYPMKAFIGLDEIGMPVADARCDLFIMPVIFVEKFFRPSINVSGCRKWWQFHRQFLVSVKAQDCHKTDVVSTGVEQIMTWAVHHRRRAAEGTDRLVVRR